MVTLYGTLGPACARRESLRRMLGAGMDGVRLNLSHGGLQQSAPWLEELQAAAAAEGVSPRLLVDLQGPELRVGALAQPLDLAEGTEVLLGGTGVPVPPAVLPFLNPGQQALLDDGRLLVQAAGPRDGGVACRVLRGGRLLPRKSIALPGVEVPSPALTEADRQNLALAARWGVTGVMQPFVRSAADLLEVRAALGGAGAAGVLVFAKLENRRGVAQLEQLLPQADEIVIARGDLGNAYPLWELPGVQKDLAAVCRRAGKPFMVVTQLLTSMEQAKVPTRAEVSDIFNAVLDGASSLMVTGETAAGRNPVEVMETLARTARQAEAWMRRGPVRP